MQYESAHVDWVESQIGVRSSHSTHGQPRTNRAPAARNLRQAARRGWQALASGAAVLMVACLTRLTNDAPRWTLLDSGLDGVYPAANALTTFALVVVVFHALLWCSRWSRCKTQAPTSARRRKLDTPNLNRRKNNREQTPQRGRGSERQQ